MDKSTIEEGLRRLAPFTYDVELPFGLRTSTEGVRPAERDRVANFKRHAWGVLLEACGGSLEGLKVLDLACCCGGFSVEAAKSGAAHVLGIDVTERFIEQANFIRDCLSLQNLEFRQMPVEQIDDSLGEFDVTFCFGILYHLQDPVSVMQQVADITKRVMLVDTRIVVEPSVKYPFWKMYFRRPYRSGKAPGTMGQWKQTDTCQMVPNRRAVVKLLSFVGFSKTSFIEPRAGLEARYYREKDSRYRRATFLAEK